MTDKPRRRPLLFNDLTEVVRDAENLEAKGYERAGNWDLAQCCTHLADWLRFPVEGFPKAPAPIRAMLWVLRKTVGRKKLLTYIETRSFPAGKPTMPQTVSPPGGDPREAIDKLRRSVNRLKEYTGPIVPSPLFGPMTKDEAVRMQLVHCAHHLSFLIPREG
jgi:Protein of unknown function (DUF1569)